MRFEAVYPISDEDPTALPVREIGPAVRFYREQLGFSVMTSDETTAGVSRDGARLGLVRKPDHDPAARTRTGPFRFARDGTTPSPASATT